MSIVKGACAVIAACAACAVEPEAGGPDEVALYRIADGETLSGIAERLSFPGGWRALAAANHIKGDRIREGAALSVPVEYVRNAGLDPFADFGLERSRRSIAARPLVACRDEMARGACATVADTRLCVEPTDASPLSDPDSDDDCADEVDGAIDCASQPGRVLVAYRAGERRELTALPQRGGLDVEAHAVDLDADGRREIVAAIPIELHNHEGWQSVRAVVIDDAGGFAASFDVAQWGAGSLIEAPDGGGCDLLATRWEWLRHPLEGEGMYLVGRRWAWRAGALAARDGEAVRRFRTYFHVTCSECDDFGPQTPAAWLSGPETSWWPELGDGTQVRATERGTITGVDPIDGALAIDVDFAGRRVRFDPTAAAYDDWRPPDVEPLAELRLGATGTTLPDMFVPADASRWVGRPVIALDDSTRALWVDPPDDAAQF
jgi:hypothetical protein